MQTPPDWAAYARTVPVLENRRQSLAFMLGLELKPQALKPLSKHTEKAARDIAHWEFPETFQNWGMPLKSDFLDLDVDPRPKIDKPENYTAAFYLAAVEVIQIVAAALDTAGIKFRAWGRTSFSCSGHFILEVPVAKSDDELLRMLNMRKAVEVNGIMVRIELRRRPEKTESLKSATLPGSVYMSKDGTGYDLIQWHALSKWRDGEVMPRLEPQEYRKLHIGMYMTLMALALLPSWDSGARHDCAFHLAGALAHEWQAGIFDEDTCQAIMQFMIDQSGDNDAKDRHKCLDDALLAIEAGRKVTGYTRLAEMFIGEDWRNAILRLRGGGNPDALGLLFDHVTLLGKGLIKSNCYIDVSSGASGYVEMGSDELRTRFKYHPKYPPILDSRGKLVEPVEIVLRSPRIRRIHAAISFPGMPFSALYTRDSAGDYQEIDADAAMPNEPLHINVAAGLQTRVFDEGDAPEPTIYAKTVKLWCRFRSHLVSNEREAEQLDQVIAHKLQRPLEKHPVGLAMVGGYRIGKSYLWGILMKQLIGDMLVYTSSGKDLTSDKPFNGIDTCLFYLCEETRFDNMIPQTQQLVKDVMRNNTLFVDKKYGHKGPTRNRAVPIFLSNDPHPKLIFDGMPDRALCIIRGESQSTLGMTQDEWRRHVEGVLDREIKYEFHVHMQSEEARMALLHYFLHAVPFDPDLITKGNDSRVDIDIEGGLPPSMQVFVEMLREGYFMPISNARMRGPQINEPFALQTATLGSRERLRERHLNYDQRFTTAKAFTRMVHDLFVVRTADGKISEADNMFKVAWHGKERMYYFRYRRGEMLARLAKARGIIIDDRAYRLDVDGEMGEAPEPTKEALAKSFMFATQQKERGYGVSSEMMSMLS